MYTTIEKILISAAHLYPVLLCAIVAAISLTIVLITQII